MDVCFVVRMGIDECSLRERRTGGAAFKVQRNRITERNEVKCLSRNRRQEPISVEVELIDFVASLQHKVRNHIKHVEVHTFHKRNGVSHFV